MNDAESQKSLILLLSEDRIPITIKQGGWVVVSDKGF